MADVAPDLLEAITKEVKRRVEGNSKIRSVLAKIQSGKATHADSLYYAKEMGDILSRTFKEHLSIDVLPNGKMYYNIAKRILEPTLTNNHNLIADVATEVQSILNNQAGIGLKAIRPTINQHGIDSIINMVSKDKPYDEVSWVLQDPIVTFAERIVDDTIKENAEFIGKSGMATTITRTIDSGACKWCRDIAGTYTYPNIPNDVYRRHDNCHCLIVSKTNKTKKVMYDGKEGRKERVERLTENQYPKRVRTTGVIAKKG